MQTGRNMMKDLRLAQTQLEQAKAELEAAMERVEEIQPDSVAPVVKETADTAANVADAVAMPKPPKKPGSARGIETMFRSAYRVQMDLTSLADNKANMMISINGIIMSIMLASVAPKLDANPWLFLPTTVLLIGSLISMIYAIIAARPRVSHQPISLEDLRNSEGNLLFFGNFANMNENEFVQGMEEMMEDKTFIYDSMIRNIYGLGSVLNKKFALLQYAYTTFMFALVTGVTSFIIVFLWLSQQV